VNSCFLLESHCYFSAAAEFQFKCVLLGNITLLHAVNLVVITAVFSFAWYMKLDIVMFVLYFCVLNLEGMLLNDANLTFPGMIFNLEFQI
jgi:hypothetical protein